MDQFHVLFGLKGQKQEASLYIPGHRLSHYYLAVTIFHLLRNGSEREVENETR
jgi:hypothetical protein